MTNFSESFERNFVQQSQEIKKPNLMVVGGTGVGKSSLINRIFGEELAKVGSGAPVTKGCERFEKNHIPLVIFDTEGYEISATGASNSNFTTKIIPEVEGRKERHLAEQIHLIWYCLSVGNHRVTDYDLENLDLISRKLEIPLAVVLTQCDTEEADDSGEGKTSRAFREVLAQQRADYPIFETSTIANLPLQIEELMEWSSTALTDDSLRRSFVGAQRGSLKLKRAEANKVVMVAAGASAATAGLNPLPLSDALLIIPQQLAMATKLAHVYGFDSLSGGVMALLKGQLVSIAGKQLASSLTKLIPLLGQVINAGVASALTGAMGVALIEIYHRAYEHYLDHKTLPDWAQLFSNENFSTILNLGLTKWKSEQK
jgi:uncharacterized protein (DUF697 family)/GTP-binding protein EngB required for normal cell division